MNDLTHMSVEIMIVVVYYHLSPLLHRQSPPAQLAPYRQHLTQTSPSLIASPQPPAPSTPRLPASPHSYRCCTPLQVQSFLQLLLAVSRCGTGTQCYYPQALGCTKTNSISPLHAMESPLEQALEHPKSPNFIDF